jgi:hypothetical protein
MSHPTETPRSELLAPSVPPSSAPLSVPTPFPLPRPRLRAIEALKRLQKSSLPHPVFPSSTVLTSPALEDNSIPSAPPPTLSSPSLASNVLPPAPTPSTIPIQEQPVPARTHLRALEVLQRLSSQARPPAPRPSYSQSEPRLQASPSTRPSKKRRLRSPPHEVELRDSSEEEEEEEEYEEKDLSGEEVIEILDSDEEFSPPTERLATEAPDWILLSRNDFHTEQVHRDRMLPEHLKNLSSAYVSPSNFCLLISI